MDTYMCTDMCTHPRGAGHVHAARFPAEQLQSQIRGWSMVTPPELEGCGEKASFTVTAVLPPYQPASPQPVSTQPQLLPSPVCIRAPQGVWPVRWGGGTPCTIGYPTSQPLLWMQHTSHPSWDNQKCPQGSRDPSGGPLGWWRSWTPRPQGDT